MTFWKWSRKKKEDNLDISKSNSSKYSDGLFPAKVLNHFVDPYTRALKEPIPSKRRLILGPKHLSISELLEKNSELFEKNSEHTPVKLTSETIEEKKTDNNKLSMISQKLQPPPPPQQIKPPPPNTPKPRSHPKRTWRTSSILKHHQKEVTKRRAESLILLPRQTESKKEETRSYSLSGHEGTSKISLGRALFSFHGQSENELSLKKDDLVIIHQTYENGWSRGQHRGKYGFFPTDYVQLLLESELLEESHQLGN